MCLPRGSDPETHTSLPCLHCRVGKLLDSPQTRRLCLQGLSLQRNSWARDGRWEDYFSSILYSIVCDGSKTTIDSRIKRSVGGPKDASFPLPS